LQARRRRTDSSRDQPSKLRRKDRPDEPTAARMAPRSEPVARAAIRRGRRRAGGRGLAVRGLRRAGRCHRPQPVRLGDGPRIRCGRLAHLTQRNSTTFTAIFVVALYLVLAATTGIVLIGIFPAMLAFRAFQRREPLAALAVAAAAVAIVFSMTVLTRH
jgi:hypothetical protein